jgi:lipopolysaccharide export system ATP-binding protein
VARLSLDGLGKSYRGRRVVNGVRLSVESGRVVGLLGPNGAGKTTTFYMAVGLIRPDAGRVVLDGDDITGLPMYLRARRGIGYLPQETSVFRKLTVRQNIAGMLEFFGFSASEREERAAALLDELGIRRLADQRAASLSGGERRRLEISRALALDPAFILLDEPFAGVDPLAVSDIKQIIFHLKHRNIGVLISDHNVRETLGACDEACIMSEGEVIEVGSPDEIAASETARRMYLGNEFRL